MTTALSLHVQAALLLAALACFPLAGHTEERSPVKNVIPDAARPLPFVLPLAPQSLAAVRVLQYITFSFGGSLNASSFGAFGSVRKSCGKRVRMSSITRVVSAR